MVRCVSNAWVTCEAVDFRAGRQAGRAICFTLLKVLCRILQNSAPGTTHIPVERKKRRPRTHNKARALFSRQCNSRSCTGLLMPFLPVPVPVPVPVLCGRLPHRAPLVLPARPRADKTTCYSPAPPTPCGWWGVHQTTRMNRDLVFLARDNEHRPAKQHELASRSITLWST